MTSPVLWYLTRATGLVALVLLTGTVVLGMTTAGRGATRSWPGSARQALHRQVSLLTLVFLAIHILTTVLDSFVKVGWAAIVVPFASPYKTLWVGAGTVAFDLLLAVAVSSMVRHHVSAPAWRALHWLAYVCWPIALLHAFGTGTDMRESWAVALALTCVASVALAAGNRALAAVRLQRSAHRAAGGARVSTTLMGANEQGPDRQLAWQRSAPK